MKAKQMTFWVVMLLVLACSLEWGTVWKITVGLAACFDLILIGMEIKGILK